MLCVGWEKLQRRGICWVVSWSRWKPSRLGFQKFNMWCPKIFSESHRIRSKGVRYVQNIEIWGDVRFRNAYWVPPVLICGIHRTFLTNFPFFYVQKKFAKFKLLKKLQRYVVDRYRIGHFSREGVCRDPNSTNLRPDPKNRVLDSWK